MFPNPEVIGGLTKTDRLLRTFFPFSPFSRDFDLKRFGHFASGLVDKLDIRPFTPS